MTWSRLKPRSQTHGAAHQKARAAAALLHHPAHPCCRCGRPLGPMGPWLHYDHDDHNKAVYNGFAHKACNVKAAGALGRARLKAQRLPRREPRVW